MARELFGREPDDAFVQACWAATGGTPLFVEALFDTIKREGLEPSAGKVYFDGRDIQTCLIDYRKRLGYVPEEQQLYPYLTGREYLELVGRLRSMPEALLAKKVASVPAFWNAEGVTLRRKGLPVREFKIDDYGAPPWPEVVLAVTRKTLDGDRAVEYVRGTNKTPSPYRFELYIDPAVWADLGDRDLAQGVVHRCAAVGVVDLHQSRQQRHELVLLVGVQRRDDALVAAVQQRLDLLEQLQAVVRHVQQVAAPVLRRAGARDQALVDQAVEHLHDRRLVEGNQAGQPHLVDRSESVASDLCGRSQSGQLQTRASRVRRSCRALPSAGSCCFWRSGEQPFGNSSFAGPGRRPTTRRRQRAPRR